MRKISFKITIAIASFSLIIALLVGITSIIKSSSAIETQADQNLLTNSREYSQELNNKFESIKLLADDLSNVIENTANLKDLKTNPRYAEELISGLKPIIKKFAESGKININTYFVMNEEFAKNGNLQDILFMNPDGKGFAETDAPLSIKDMKNDKDSFGWFYSPIESGKGIWTDPYEDTTLKMKLLTYSVPVIVDNVTIGVVGIDIKFESFENLIKGIKLYDSGSGSLVNNKLDYIVDPKYTQKDNLGKIEGGKLEKLAGKIKKAQSGIQGIRLNGKDLLFGYSKLSNDYILIITVPKSEVLETISQMTLFIIIIIAAGVLIAAAAAYYIGSLIAMPVNSLTKMSKTVETGDLTIEYKSDSSDEIGRLSKSFNSMISKIRLLISDARRISEKVVISSEEINMSTKDIRNNSEQIAMSISELAKGANEQAVSTEKANNMITEIVKELDKVVSSINAIENLTAKTNESIEKGTEAVNRHQSCMDESKVATDNVSNTIYELDEKSAAIGHILEVIKGISDQTNLLALNAAIEAARAGEYGKGFAVVSDEIRKLAEQSGVSVKKIDNIIKEVQTGVRNAVLYMKKEEEAVKRQGDTMSDTINAFKQVAEAMDVISANVKEVAFASSTVNKSIVQSGNMIRNIASIAEETAAGTEQIAASNDNQSNIISNISDSMKELAGEVILLKQNISKFKV